MYIFDTKTLTLIITMTRNKKMFAQVGPYKKTINCTFEVFNDVEETYDRGATDARLRSLRSYWRRLSWLRVQIELALMLGRRITRRRVSFGNPLERRRAVVSDGELFFFGK